MERRSRRLCLGNLRAEDLVVLDPHARALVHPQQQWHHRPTAACCRVDGFGERVFSLQVVQKPLACT